MKPKISLFASSIRPNLWEAFFKSLEGTSVDVEVVFAGNIMTDDYSKPAYKNLIYIKTANIKPAQCYEVARRHCTGELIMWVADDCEFPNDVLGKAYKFWKDKCTYKDIVCMKTREHYYKWFECDETHHFFMSENKRTPKMAPIGLMNREYFKELGGIDKRFIAGQWDNDLMIRLYNDGGKLYYFGDAYVELDHANKHDGGLNKMCTRDFALAFEHDRNILEKAWVKNGVILPKPQYRRFDTGFEPYSNEELNTKSQSFNMESIWND